MAKDVSFWLNPAGGAYVLQLDTQKVLVEAANKIANRATYMSKTVSSNPPQFKVTNKVGVIRRGERRIAYVYADATNKHQTYIAKSVLPKSTDAGKV